MFVAFLAVTVSGLTIAGLADPDRNPNAQADPVPTETLDAGDEIIKIFNTLHFPPDVLSEAPTTGTVIGAWWYAPVDVEAELPYVAWHQAEPPAPYTAADVLTTSDLLLSLPGFHCSVTGVVVIETETTVTVGIAVTQAPPTPKPTETIGPDGIATPLPSPTKSGLDMTCVQLTASRAWFPIDLASPLGDRNVVNLNGQILSAYRAPISY